MICTPFSLNTSCTWACNWLSASARLRGLTTFEFLLDAQGGWFFIEANPRLQVEHTVTEEVFGCDLVVAQLRLALGTPLADVGLTGLTPRGTAVQARVNADHIPAGATLSRFDRPPDVTGSGIGMASYVQGAIHDFGALGAVATGQPAVRGRGRAGNTASGLGMISQASSLEVQTALENLDLELGVPLLGRLPLVQALREGGDDGKPIAAVAPESELGRAFHDIAKRIATDMKPKKIFSKLLKIN